MDRRDLLRTAGVRVSALVAGCSALGVTDAGPYPHLGKVLLTNHDLWPHDLRVVVEQRDTVAFEGRRRLDTRSADPDGAHRWRLPCAWSGWVPFVVRCSVDSGETERHRVDRAAPEYQSVFGLVGSAGDLRVTGAPETEDTAVRCGPPVTRTPE